MLNGLWDQLVSLFWSFPDIFSGLFRISNCLDVKLWRYKYCTTNLPYHIESEGGIVWFYVKIRLQQLVFYINLKKKIKYYTFTEDAFSNPDVQQMLLNLHHSMVKTLIDSETKELPVCNFKQPEELLVCIKGRGLDQHSLLSL